MNVRDARDVRYPCFFCNTKELSALVERLQTTYEVWAPTSDSATGQVFFERLIKGGKAMSFDATLPAMPPKEVLLPQIDRILRYRYDGQTQNVRLEPCFDDRPKALIGLRPCDLAGVQCLDRFLLGQEFVDEVYLAHRKKSFIVVNNCTTPWAHCFCVCTDTGPAAREGFDLSLTKMDESADYLVEVGSERGAQLARECGLRAAGEDALKRKEKIIDRAIERFPAMATENKAWISRAMNRLTTGFIKHETWEQIGKQCFECGACSFVCPTCSCFNIEDLPCGDGACDRLRTRDSCSLEGYTRMAGDHNPRKPVEDRRNKRFFCKLSYSQSKKYLRPSCVGCGRCVWVCPGDIGMPNVVITLHREKKS